MEKAQIHADTILAKLDNKHSIFQLFKFCTAHKLTHLFSVDVLSTATHPRNWNTWDSDLCLDFNTMVSQMIGALTNNCAPPPRTCNSDPIHEHKKRGLGIQQPRSTAIPAYFLAVKQDVQHVTEGVWTSNPPPPPLPYCHISESCTKTGKQIRHTSSNLSKNTTPISRTCASAK